MKNVVYYFTGTGNSMIVAKDITKAIGGEVKPISTAINESAVAADAEVIGIVFPVYIWGVPLIVKRFIKKIEKLSDKYIFAIGTYGENPGAALKIFDKEIRKCGGRLSGGFAVQMPANYIPMGGAIEEEKQRRIFEEESRSINDIAEYVERKGEGTLENNKNPFYNMLFTHIIYNLSNKYIPKMDRNFYIDDKCNKCGLCQKVCPVGNVKMTDAGPSWNKGCEQCFACLQWCPQNAIQHGKNTSDRKRYHHPDISISEFIKQYDKKKI